jgi:ATP-dependent Clp protease ATP-binding subunit ClpA
VKAQLAGQEMDLVVTDAAKDAIIVKGYDQAYGARPLRREIQNQIEDPLAERMLQAAFSPGDTIIIDVGADETLTIERSAPAKRQPAKAAR